MATQSNVQKLYMNVVNDVLDNVRESFLDEGVDEQVLHDLKQLWENKLQQSKAFDGTDTKKSQMALLNEPQRQMYMQHQQLQAQTAQPQVQVQQPQVQVQQPQVQMQPQVQVQPQVRMATLAQPQVQVTAPQQQQQAQVQVAGAAFSQTAGATYGMVRQPQPTMVSTLQTTPQAAQPQAAPQMTLSGGNVINPQQLAALQGGGTIIGAVSGQGGALNYVIQLPSGQHQLLPASAVTTTAAPAAAPANVPYTLTAQVPPANPQQQQAAAAQSQQQVLQIDGANDSSSDDDDDDDDDDKDDDDGDEQNEEENEFQGEEDSPLNSEDDISEEDPGEVFDTDNVVVCQFDKINRSKNRWKFHLKDGIMNLNGKDFVFLKATGDAEW